MKRAVLMGIAPLTALGANGAMAAADARAQFDLICVGTRTPGLIDPPVPYRIVYRVDLQAMKYCWDDCDRPLRDIAWADAQWIGFEGNKQESPAPGASVAFVNRVTGKYQSYIVGRSASTEAECEPAPFKGFPHPQTKF